MRIYTRQGDAGQTRLPGDLKVAKTDGRIVACGALDELNSVIGLARTAPLADRLDRWLGDVQGQLLVVGAIIAGCGTRRPSQLVLDPAVIGRLENQIDEIDASLAPLRQFILPGGCPAGAALHWARTVCRRAEIAVAELNAADWAIQPAAESTTSANHAVLPREVAAYLNRLADWLFVMARWTNAEAGTPEPIWDSSRRNEGTPD